jgi:hypothetical protein
MRSLVASIDHRVGPHARTSPFSEGDGWLKKQQAEADRMAQLIRLKNPRSPERASMCRR